MGLFGHWRPGTITNLVAENARRGKTEPEYELVDTGIFDESRYWVVTVDYAKAAPRDLLMRITVENAGPDEATIHVLPTFWFRNTWSWGYDDHPKPTLRLYGERIGASHSKSGPLVMIGDGNPEKFFCDNETKNARLFGAGLWDEQDSYFYDILHLTNGTDIPIKVKSLVGLVPISAALSYSRFNIHDPPDFFARADWFLQNHPEYLNLFHTRDIGGERRRLLAMVPPERLVRVLDNVFEEKGLLSEFAIPAISAWHREHPFSVQVGGVTASVDYEPAESTTNLFGGNSNWRGPIWMPLNALLIEALSDYDELAPGEVTVHYPAGSGERRSLAAAADDISRRLVSIFLP